MSSRPGSVPCRPRHRPCIRVGVVVASNLPGGGRDRRADATTPSAPVVSTASKATTPAISPLGKWSHEATVQMWYPGYVRTLSHCSTYSVSGLFRTSSTRGATSGWHSGGTKWESSHSAVVDAASPHNQQRPRIGNVAGAGSPDGGWTCSRQRSTARWGREGRCNGWSASGTHSVECSTTRCRIGDGGGGRDPRRDQRNGAHVGNGRRRDTVGNGRRRDTVGNGRRRDTVGNGRRRDTVGCCRTPSRRGYVEAGRCSACVGWTRRRGCSRRSGRYLGAEYSEPGFHRSGQRRGRAQ